MRTSKPFLLVLGGTLAASCVYPNIEAGSSAASGGDSNSGGVAAIGGASKSLTGGNSGASQVGGSLNGGGAASGGASYAGSGTQSLGGISSTTTGGEAGIGGITAVPVGGDAATGGSHFATNQSTGGAVGFGGSMPLGGSSATGGTGNAAASSPTGGAPNAGATNATGGYMATSGTIAVGGTKSTGGSVAAGGAPATGGAAGGARPTTGGAATGGAVTGGASPTGGTPATGGAATGGYSATPGCPGTGGPTMVALPLNYCIDSTEVTRGQYMAWLDTKPPTSNQISVCLWNASFEPFTDWPPASGALNYPVVWVDWCDAYAYCTGVGKRLCGKIGGGSNDYDDYDKPTKSQWYAACTSNGMYSSTGFPYGDTYQATYCNGVDANSGAAVAVRTMSQCQSTVPGYEAVYDLSGNVWEWEDSCYATSGSSDPCRFKGGAFNDFGVVDGVTVGLDCGSPSGGSRSVALDYIGFRCCSP
jgi:formylglycine-generating enzyme